MSSVLMKCGHSSNGVRASDKAPVCVICIRDGGPDDPATQVETNPPDLSGRLMHCSYMRGRNGKPCAARENPIPSDPKAAFFAHKPDEEFDQFYCGCWGWD